MKIDSWDELRSFLPGGVSSPVRSGYQVGVSLPIISRGKGAWIEDIEKRRYLDCCLSWGALLHGHAPECVVLAAKQAIEEGSTFGTSTLYELSLAKMIKKALPSMEKIRFVSTGTEATMSAVRLARAYTGRNKIIKCIGNYHGHADQFLVQAGSGVAFLSSPSSSGVPSSFTEHTLSLPFNDLASFFQIFESFGKEIAGVIVEPVAANMGVVPPDPLFLQGLRDLTHDRGALLIFDEVISGFRVGWGGAQGLYGVTPDLTCLGKIIGGGLPAAAFGGKNEIMELLAPLGNVYQAGTLSGNPVAMRAGYAALQLASHPNFYESLEKKAKKLLDPIEKVLFERKISACIQRVGSMFTIFFGTEAVRNSSDLKVLDNQKFKDFFSFMLKKGIYIPPAHNEAWFLSSAHTEENVEYISSSALEFLNSLYQS